MEKEGYLSVGNHIERYLITLKGNRQTATAKPKSQYLLESCRNSITDVMPWYHVVQHCMTCRNAV
jgi:hypothetical protein